MKEKGANCSLNLSLKNLHIHAIFVVKVVSLSLVDGHVQNALKKNVISLSTHLH